MMSRTITSYAFCSASLLQSAITSSLEYDADHFVTHILQWLFSKFAKLAAVYHRM